MRARFVNDSGRMKEIKVGYSWTVFFFAFFVPLVRGDVRNFFIQFAIEIIFAVANMIIPVIPILAYMGYNTFYLAMQYNKMYAKALIKKGFRPATDVDEQILRSKGYPVAQ